MKKLYLLLSFLALLGVLRLDAHDFAKRMHGNGTYPTDSVWYNIISENPAEVAVTFRGDRYNSFSGEYSGVVVIPSTVSHDGVTYSVTAIGRDAFSGCGGITELTVPETVDSIYGNFSNLNSLVKLDWQPIRPVVGDYGRDWQASLANTKVSEVRFRHYVPVAMCQRCNNLSRVTFDATMDSIAADAFRDIPGDFQISFADGMKRLFIGQEAFHSSRLDTVALPSSVTDLTVCARAFENSWIKSFVMPDSATVLFDLAVSGRGGGAFLECDSLRSITIPRGTVYLRPTTFAGCDSLKSVTWNAARHFETSEVGVVAPGPSRDELRLFDRCPNIASLVIGEEVEMLPCLYPTDNMQLRSIHYNAVAADAGYIFSDRNGGYQNAVELLFSDRVETIPSRAFYNMRGTKEVTLPESVKSLGCNAFWPVTVIKGADPMGYTVSIDRGSCDLWDKVYIYAKYSDNGDFEPLGKFPGVEMTALDGGLLSFTFPMEYCLSGSYSNLRFSFSDGTNSNRTREIPLVGDNRIYALPERHTGDNILPSEIRPAGELPADDGTLLVKLTDAPLPAALSVTLVKPQAESALWQKAWLLYEVAGNGNTVTVEMTPAADGSSFSFTFPAGEEVTYIRFRNYTDNDGSSYDDHRESVALTIEDTYYSKGFGLFYPMVCTLQDEGSVDRNVSGYSGVPLRIVASTPDYAALSRFSSFDFSVPYGSAVFSKNRNNGAWRLHAGGDAGRPGSGWAVSPVVDASAVECLTLGFDHSFSNTDGITDITLFCNLLVTADGAKWDTVAINWPEYGSGAQSGRKASVSISLDRWKGERTQVAFAYRWTPEFHPDWTIENLHITSAPVSGQGGEGGLVKVEADAPETALHFYDIDGDGLMEYFSAARSSDSNTKIYDNYGHFRSTLPLGGALISVEDMDRSGAPELIAMGNDYDGKPSLTVNSISGAHIAGLYPPGRLYGEKYTQVFDADGDGRMDIYVNYAESVHSIFYQQPDGTYIERRIETVVDPEEINEAMFAQYGANPVIQPPINFSGAALAKAPRPPHLMAAPAADAPQRAAAAPIFADDAVTSMDINMDGLPDLLNLYNGNALLSLGDNRYYYGDFGGAVTAKDVSGDGIPDYIVYNEDEKKVRLLIYEGEDSFKSQTLMQNFNITGIYCYDFDRDGDVDILLPFDYTESAGYSYLVFFENQGDNNFRKREKSMTDKMRFLGCGDFDNDGLYEVVGLMFGAEMTDELNSNGEPLWKHTREFYLIECNADFTFTKGEEPDITLLSEYKYEGEMRPDDIGSEHYGSPLFVYGDFDNDGFNEFWTEWDNNLYRGVFTAAQANTAPGRMEAPTFVEDAASGTLRVEWKAGADASSSACDISYALRIGTAPGRGDVWFAHASADGRRLRPGEGNAAYNLFQIVRTSTWLPGDYYISVQAIDAQGLGGEWSDEVVFTNKVLNSALAASPAALSTMDTLTVSLSMPYSADYAYEWDFGADAVVVSRDATSARVCYTQAGAKTLSVSITDTEGRTASAETSVEVFAVKVGNIDSYARSGATADFDMDGTLELLGHVSKDGKDQFGLFENDGKGTLTKVGYTFNSDLEPGEQKFVTDFNLDGLPDFMTGANKGNLFINNGDLDFSYSTEDFGGDMTADRFFFFNQRNLYTDFNHDGYTDLIIGESDIYINAGDNLTFTELDPRAEFGFSSWYMLDDFNGDGWLDFITGKNAGSIEGYGYNAYYCHFNNGDGTLAPPVEMTELNRAASRYKATDIRFLLSADMNNDGYKDILCSASWRSGSEDSVKTFLLLDDGTGAFAERVDLDLTIDEYGGSGTMTFDFDNNGYPDLVERNILDQYGSKNNYSILYFYPGMETRLQVLTEGSSYFDWEIAGDLNGDGVPDGYDFDMYTRHSNAAPSAPGNVRAVQTDDMVTLMWDDAADAETPATQMRYNVSLRRAGRSGDGSYIISPLNGGSDLAAPLPGNRYMEVTGMSLPVERFTAGEQYELKVQAIDLWGKQSPFSDVYTFEVGSVVAIDAPDETCLGSETVITYKGTEGGTPEWSLDGATVIAKDGNSVTAKWDVTGTKQISVTVAGVTSTRPITVRESIDMTFSLPDLVLAGAEVPFTLPEVFSRAGVSVGVRTSDGTDMSGSTATIIPTFGGGYVGKGHIAEEPKIKVERRSSTLEARVTFNTDPGYGAWIELYCIDPVCGEVSCRRSVMLTAENITPEISIVTVDAASGHNKVMWDVPSDLPAGLFTDMAVYREEGATNNFVEIGRVPLANGEFIDLQSDPTVRKYRYRLALVTSYGGFSTMGEPHSSVHVMLNRGMGSSINIIWTPYDGGTIEQYSILRGTDAENMSVIHTASGYETSYTDKTAAPGADYFYALSYSNIYEGGWRPMNAPARAGINRAPAARAAGQAGLSNVVGTSESKTVTFAESLSILTLEKLYELNPSVRTLHCYAEISPAMATYRQVNWSVISGNNLASIDASGVLTYAGGGANGIVTVKAVTVDGSGISETRTVRVTGFTEAVPVSSVVVTAPYTELTPQTRTVALMAEVLPANATDRSVSWSVVSGSAVVSVGADGHVSAKGFNGTATVRATANDGSGIYGEITLTATGFTGETVKVESVHIIAPYTELTPDNYGSVQLTAEVLPEEATDRTVAWEAVSGGELVEINVYGLVRAKGVNGTVVIRASATDGSGVYDEVTLTVSGYGNDLPLTEKPAAILWPVPAKDVINVECACDIERIEILSPGGRTLISLGGVSQADVSSLPDGVYLMRVTSACGTELRQFTVTR